MISHELNFEPLQFVVDNIAVANITVSLVLIFCSALHACEKTVAVLAKEPTVDIKLVILWCSAIDACSNNQ